MDPMLMMQIADKLPTAESTIGAGVGLYSAYKSFTGPDVKYDILKLKEGAMENAADAILLKAQAEANIARQQFSGAIGSFQAQTARRNVKVGSGGAGENVEMSSRDFGLDMAEMKENATFKADQLRFEGEMYAEAAKGQKEITKWERYGALTDTLTKLTKLDFKGLSGEEEPKEGEAQPQKPSGGTTKKQASNKVYSRKGQASQFVGM